MRFEGRYQTVIIIIAYVLTDIPFSVGIRALVMTIKQEPGNLHLAIYAVHRSFMDLNFF